MIPTSKEEWEALSIADLERYSDLQLKKVLQEHFGLRSHVYFMSAAKKKQFIADPDSRRTLQLEAEERQKAHKAAGAAHRGKKPVKELIAERSEGHAYTFAGVDRPQGGFTDPFNDRKGAVAYTVTDVADGETYPVQKQTAKALTELGRLTGFDERISAAKQKPAHKAGLSTIEDVIAGGDPKVQEVAKAVTEETHPLRKVDVKDLPAGSTTDAVKNLVEPKPLDRESELNDILNSLSG